MRITKTNNYQTNYWEDFSDDAAASYMETYGEGPGFELRHKIGSLIKPGEHVLDVGCGPGWNLDHFINFGPAVGDYLGLDYSEKFVRVANQRHGEDLFFKVGDVRDIKEADSSWDVVIVQDCLEHTNGYETPVKEALRVAKRIVIVTFWHLEDTDDPHINDDGSDTWGTWYDKREWETYLDNLPNQWTHERLVMGDPDHDPDNVRHRDVYVINKETNEETQE